MSGGTFLLFFPEGLLAAVVVLASPFWFFSLLWSGQLGAAGMLVAGLVVSGGVFWFGIRQHEKYIAYLGVGCALVSAYLVMLASK